MMEFYLWIKAEMTIYRKFLILHLFQKYLPRGLLRRRTKSTITKSPNFLNGLVLIQNNKNAIYFSQHKRTISSTRLPRASFSLSDILLRAGSAKKKIWGWDSASSSEYYRRKRALGMRLAQRWRDYHMVVNTDIFGYDFLAQDFYQISC